MTRVNECRRKEKGGVAADDVLGGKVEVALVFLFAAGAVVHVEDVTLVLVARCLLIAWIVCCVVCVLGEFWKWCERWREERTLGALLVLLGAGLPLLLLGTDLLAARAIQDVGKLVQRRKVAAGFGIILCKVALRCCAGGL